MRFNTRYLDAAITQLRAVAMKVREADVTRLSPILRDHLNGLGAVLVPAAGHAQRWLATTSDPQHHGSRWQPGVSPTTTSN
ncbi:MAG: Tn3 family transposase [Pseudonocardiaceae bacterium]